MAARPGAIPTEGDVGASALAPMFSPAPRYEEEDRMDSPVVSYKSGASANSLFCYSENTEEVLRLQRLVLVMVGLPATGKSYITHKLCRYIRWMGFQARAFNAGAYRRKLFQNKGSNDDAFRADNEDAVKVRQQMAEQALDDLLLWLRKGKGYVGILDATNSTRARRRMILERCRPELNVQVVFIESICREPKLIEANILMKLENDDYKSMNPAEARQDFELRVQKYNAIYEPMGEEEEDLAYIQLYDVGAKIVINQCHGYLVSQISTCLNNMHVQSRYIWLTRHGQSEDNAKGVLGGDSPLTAAGQAYAKRLAKYMQHRSPQKLLVWTSCLIRTLQTAQPLRETMQVAVHSTPLLNEIAGGQCDSLTETELEQKHPDIFHARQEDKLRYRYPGGGESYLDVIERVKPLILELERLRVPVLVICHKAVLRTLLAYFTDMNLDKMTTEDIPLNTVLQLNPTAYGCDVTRIKLHDDEALAAAIAQPIVPPGALGLPLPRTPE